MIRIFAVATLAVMSAYPPAGHAMENGLLRNGRSLQNGITPNGLALHNGIVEIIDASKHAKPWFST
jgi:hypothetical protein